MPTVSTVCHIINYDVHCNGHTCDNQLTASEVISSWWDINVYKCDVFLTL